MILQAKTLESQEAWKPESFCASSRAGMIAFRPPSIQAFLASAIQIEIGIAIEIENNMNQAIQPLATLNRFRSR